MIALEIIIAVLILIGYCFEEKFVEFEHKIWMKFKRWCKK